jgi:large subunit ribosomal protein L24
MRVKKGDEVVVLSGKYAGHRAEVIRALPATDQVVLDSVNIAKRHTKQVSETSQAGIIDKFMPLHVSAVSLWCKGHNGPARAGTKVDGDKKTRVCRKCGAEL